MSILIEQIINGLLVGSFYTLLALGLSLIFSLGGVVNLAHGAFYAIGAYIAVTLTPLVGYPAALLLSPVAVALIGVAIETTLLRRLYRHDPILTLLFTFGLAIVIEQCLRLIFGPAGLPFNIPDFLRGVVLLGDFIYPYYRIFILALTLVSVVLIWLLLTKTRFGLIVRAGQSDPEIVEAMGVDLRPVQSVIFGIGIGLAALSGVIAAPLAGVQPAMGADVVTAAFVIVVIGGLGSFWGVLLAGLIVGVVRGITITISPPRRRGVDLCIDGACSNPAAPRPVRRTYGAA